MRIYVTKLCLLVFAATAILPALALSEEQKSATSIALLSFKNVESAVVERIAEHLEKSLQISVRTVKSEDALAGKKKRNKQISVLLQKNDAAVLVLATEGGTKKKFVVSMESLNAAILDVSRLFADVPSGTDGDAVRVRRVEKEAVRIVSRLLGMKDCPMLRCALYLPQNSKELDQKGRNLCPPCQQKLANLLKKKGIPQTPVPALVIEKKPAAKPAEKATPGASKEGSGE